MDISPYYIATKSAEFPSICIQEIDPKPGCPILFIHVSNSLNSLKAPVILTYIVPYILPHIALNPKP